MVEAVVVIVGAPILTLSLLTFKVVCVDVKSPGLGDEVVAEIIGARWKYLRRSGYGEGPLPVARQYSHRAPGVNFVAIIEVRGIIWGASPVSVSVSVALTVPIAVSVAVLVTFPFTVLVAGSVVVSVAVSIPVPVGVFLRGGDFHLFQAPGPFLAALFRAVHAMLGTGV